jgi:hypothetical protein
MNHRHDPRNVMPGAGSLRIIVGADIPPIMVGAANPRVMVGAANPRVMVGEGPPSTSSSIQRSTQQISQPRPQSGPA